MVSSDDLKFDQVNDMKTKWEHTQLGRKEINAEKRREEQSRVRQLMLRVRKTNKFERSKEIAISIHVHVIHIPTIIFIFVMITFQGKNESVKAMYQAQVEQEAGQPKRNSVVLEIETNAKSMKERFEKGDDLVYNSERNKEVPDLELFTGGKRVL